MKKRIKIPNLATYLKEKGISGRSLTLFGLLFLLTIMLAPPIQHYFAQRAQISALEADVASNQMKLLEVRAELEKWRDPVFIKSEARARLHFVLPGERQYIVIGIDDPATNGKEGATPVSEQIPIGIPWYSRLIASITNTGSPTP